MLLSILGAIAPLFYLLVDIFHLYLNTNNQFVFALIVVDAIMLFQSEVWEVRTIWTVCRILSAAYTIREILNFMALYIRNW